MNEVKEWSNKVIQQTCETVNLPEEIVTAVLKHQWRKAKRATKECNEVEFSGFGKFFVMPHRLKKRIYRYERLKAAWANSLQNGTNQLDPQLLQSKIDILETETEGLRVRYRKHENKS